MLSPGVESTFTQVPVVFKRLKSKEKSHEATRLIQRLSLLSDTFISTHILGEFVRIRPVSGTSVKASKFLQFPGCLSATPGEENRCEGSARFILLHQRLQTTTVQLQPMMIVITFRWNGHLENHDHWLTAFHLHPDKSCLHSVIRKKHKAGETSHFWLYLWYLNLSGGSCELCSLLTNKFKSGLKTLKLTEATANRRQEKEGGRLVLQHVISTEQHISL